MINYLTRKELKNIKKYYKFFCSAVRYGYTPYLEKPILKQGKVNVPIPEEEFLIKRTELVKKHLRDFKSIIEEFEDYLNSCLSS